MAYKFVPQFQELIRRLRARGFEVVEVDGWQSRGHGDFVSILGEVNHHTVDNGPADYPSLKVVVSGRPDLAGPLCNTGVGRSGTIYIVAAGVAWHAGATLLPRQGNKYTLGKEIANNGVGEPYPAVQIAASVAITEESEAIWGFETSHVEGHKEVCSPRGRKTDPSFDMAHYRSLVGSRPSGPNVPQSNSPVTVPVSPPPAPSPVDESRRAPDRLPTVSAATPRGDGWAALAQKLLAEVDLYNGRIDGWIGSGSVAAIRAGQRRVGVKDDGVVGPVTWAAFLGLLDSVLRPGEHKGSAAVELLQNLVGYRPGAGLDADFGSATKGRVMQVQRWGDLTGDAVDGVVGPQTRAIFARA